jgi:sugar phosphate isomerase/epimerase
MKWCRREFIKAAGAVAALGTGFDLGGREANAADTTESTKMARLLPGCCAYSFRKYLASKQMTMEDFIRKGVELRTLGLDMTVYWFQSTRPDYLAGLRHLAFQCGIPFSGVGCGSSMVQATQEKRDRTLAEIKHWVDVTDQLGASHLRVFGGKLPSGATQAQAVDWVVESMKHACEYAGKKGITLGIEDHGGITQQAETCLEIMHRVDSPFAGINLDITHFLPTATLDGYAQIEMCLPYATHAHIRDHFDDGTPIDLERVWQMFAKAGYRGYLSLEYGGKEEAMTAIPKQMALIEQLCRKYSTAG